MNEASFLAKIVFNSVVMRIHIFLINLDHYLHGHLSVKPLSLAFSPLKVNTYMHTYI